MKRTRRRKCRHCGQLFDPDPRNRHHQKYCSASACRRASKAASQRRWLANPINRHYFRGPAHVARVQRWRAAHPGDGRRTGAPVEDTLQDHCMRQPVEPVEKTTTLPERALQDLLFSQPYVLIGLIANLTGSALQEDIVRSGRQLQQLGRDILAGGTHDAQNPIVSRAPTPDSNSEAIRKVCYLPCGTGMAHGAYQVEAA